jgi:methyl-accepting chemotaxis protein
MLLRTKLALVSIGGSLLLAAVALSLLWWLNGMANARNVQSLIEGKAQLWAAQSQAWLNAMAQETKFLARDRATVDAIGERSVDAVRESLTTALNRLSTSGLISDLLLFDTDLRLLYRGVAPAIAAPSAVVAEALRSTSVQQGLVVGEGGSLRLQLAFPLYKRRDLVGVGVFERDLRPLLSRLQSSDTDLVAFAAPSGWSLFDGDVARDVLVARAAALVAQGSEVLAVAEQSYLALAVPLPDQTGATIGYLLHGSDRTQLHARYLHYTIGGVACLVLVTVFAAATIWRVTSRGFRPLTRATDALQALAQGDLSFTAEAVGKDEAGVILGHLQATCERLRQTMCTIRLVAQQVQESASSLKSQTDGSAAKLSEQDRAVTETATSTAELNSATESIRADTGAALAHTRSARECAATGLSAVDAVSQAIARLSARVRDTGSAVQRLEQDSASILAIVGVISEIAAKTNLIALNAAIEAARAGEHGRAFAVVADEVRGLALKTTESAARIKDIVGLVHTGIASTTAVMHESQSAADNAVTLTDDAHAAIVAIVGAIDRIHGSNDHIAHSAQAQTQQVGTIDVSMRALRDGFAQTSAYGAAIRETAQELASTANQLATLLEAFRIQQSKCSAGGAGDAVELF